MKSIVIISSLMFGCFLFQTASAQSKKEILVVEVYPNWSKGIYITWAGRDTEIIDFVGTSSLDKIKERGKILRDLFQRLYDEGWEIETSTVTSAEGSTGIIQYILMREK